MPELPEVQTTINVIKPKIINKTIINFEYELPKMVQFYYGLDEECLQHAKLIDLYRRGKYLLFSFDNDITMVVHLRMEGKFFINDPQRKHNYVFITFDDGMLLTYNDTRKFGTVDILPTNMLADFKPLAKLGQEPLKEMNRELIYQAIHKSKKHIKTILLDQTIIVGIGNIYADEILFDCKLSPLTRGNKITKKQVDQIIDSTKIILDNSIKNMGTSFKTYETIAVKGRNQLVLKAYQNHGNPCSHCQTPLEKMKVNGRGTHYCPHCQVEVK